MPVIPEGAIESLATLVYPSRDKKTKKIKSHECRVVTTPCSNAIQLTECSIESLASLVCWSMRGTIKKKKKENTWVSCADGVGRTVSQGWYAHNFQFDAAALHWTSPYSVVIVMNVYVSIEVNTVEASRSKADEDKMCNGSHTRRCNWVVGYTSISIKGSKIKDKITRMSCGDNTMLQCYSPDRRCNWVVGFTSMFSPRGKMRNSSDDRSWSLISARYSCWSETFLTRR